MRPRAPLTIHLCKTYIVSTFCLDETRAALIRSSRRHVAARGVANSATTRCARAELPPLLLRWKVRPPRWVVTRLSGLCDLECGSLGSDGVLALACAAACVPRFSAAGGIMRHTTGYMAGDLPWCAAQQRLCHACVPAAFVSDRFTPSSPCSNQKSKFSMQYPDLG